MSWLLPPMLPNHQAALRDVRARSHQARLAAAQRLGMADGSQREDAAEGLRTLLDDRDPRVVAASLESLTQLAPTGAAAWIARALGASRVLCAPRQTHD